VPWRTGRREGLEKLKSGRIAADICAPFATKVGELKFNERQGFVAHPKYF
jgi:hypothetical protein